MGNSARIKGNDKAIRGSYRAARMLAEEIEDIGLLHDPDALGFLARQEQMCDEIDNAQEAYLKSQTEHLHAMRRFVDDMRRWLDTKLTKP